ncbi:MAG TPA: dihydroneopterin aldolase [Acidimicrobiia bacterium]|nr:dihydroneopterin aldolase [Acidimicrobiia bacterium]
MTDRIDLTGIQVRARHGALPEEKEKDQLFVVDVGIFIDTGPAAASDDLIDTVDYAALTQRIHDVVARQTHNLIETVANHVAGLAMKDPRVERVIVTIHKPQAPMPFDFTDVSVTVDRAR